MANIVTGFFRLYCPAQASWSQAHVSRKGLLKALLASQHGKSYYVPVWSRHMSPQTVDLQAGFPWGIASALSGLQERFGERLEGIWARSFNEGWGTDQIEYLPCAYDIVQDAGKRYWGECRYACDRVELHWRPEVPPSLKDQCVFSCNVFYRGSNDRCFLRSYDDAPSLRTPTTPAGRMEHPASASLGG